MIGLDAWIRRDADEQEEEWCRGPRAHRAAESRRSVSDGFFVYVLFASGDIRLFLKCIHEGFYSQTTKAAPRESQ